MFQSALLVFLGGGLGSLARFGISAGVKQFPAVNFPVATLLANVLSCAIIGIALLLFAEKMENNALRLFVIAGFCGGFSTFSTFSLETLELIRRGQTLIGIANIAVSVGLCLFILATLVRK
jgi:fluoride exporter